MFIANAKYVIDYIYELSARESNPPVVMGELVEYIVDSVMAGLPSECEMVGVECVMLIGAHKWCEVSILYDVLTVAQAGQLLDFKFDDTSALRIERIEFSCGA